MITPGKCGGRWCGLQGPVQVRMRPIPSIQRAELPGVAFESGCSAWTSKNHVGKSRGVAGGPKGGSTPSGTGIGAWRPCFAGPDLKFGNCQRKSLSGIHVKLVNFPVCSTQPSRHKMKIQDTGGPGGRIDNTIGRNRGSDHVPGR